MPLWNNSTEPVKTDTVWSDEDSYKGKAATITIGSVEAVEQGQESITNVGSLTDAILNFKLPIGNTGDQGIQGLTGTIAIGTVSTGNEGTNVVITNTGSPSEAILDITIPRGDTGITGSKGWSPVFAVVTDGTRKVLKVSDWQGGEGTKPVVNVYMGVAGYTYVIGDAVDIRGTQGIQGIKGDTGDNGLDGVSTYAELADKASVDLPTVNTPLSTALSGKQTTLVSGANIKTVNNVSLLGSGDVGIDSGKYSCSVWKEGDSINPVTGTIGSYNIVWQNDGQLNTTTGVYTVPVAGLYNVQFDCLKHNDNTSTEVRLYKNGSATGVRSYMNTTNASEYTNGHFNVTGYFNVSDELDVRVTSGGVHGNESCYLNIHKLR